MFGRRAAKAGALRHPRWTIAATMLASSLAFIDGSVTNVALPAIGRDLHGGAADLQWTINAYLLPLSALLLLGGAAGDHYRTAANCWSPASCSSRSPRSVARSRRACTMLLAARAIQGVGAALLMPNSLGILGSSFEGEARGRAVGTWAAAGAIASAIGPPLGGWLVGAVGWRAIFYLNLPVAAAAIAIALLFVTESAEGRRDARLAGRPPRHARARCIDLGAHPLVEPSPASLADLARPALRALLLGLFLWIERRRGDRAMMPLGLFGSRPFVGLSLLTFLLYGALGGLLVLLPYLLIVGGGYSPLQAGIRAAAFLGRDRHRLPPRRTADGEARAALAALDSVRSSPAAASL